MENSLQLVLLISAISPALGAGAIPSNIADSSKELTMLTAGTAALIIGIAYGAWQQNRVLQKFKNNNSDNLTKLRTDLDQAFNYGAEKFKETFNHGADRFAVVLARVDISVNSALKKAHLKHTVDNANPMVAVKVCLANVNTSFQDMFQLLQNKTMFSQLIQTANFLKLPGPRKENFLNLSHRIQTEDITDISELGPDGAIVIDIIREVVPLVEPGTGEASALASRILTNVVEPVIHTNILFIAVVIIRAIVIFKSNRFGFKGF